MQKSVFYKMAIVIVLSITSSCSNHKPSMNTATRQSQPTESKVIDPVVESPRQLDPALADELKNKPAVEGVAVPTTPTPPPAIPAPVSVEPQPTLATPVLQSSTVTEDVNEPAAFKGMVAAHNRWRQKVNVSAVRWSVDVASVAQRWANQLQTKGCPLEHSYQGGYGENIAASTGMGLTPERVVDLWASEVEDYDYVNNRCKAGKVCGHYTQVVWQASAEIGCGKASCGNTEVWVCNYNPPGNYVGTKPY